MRKIKTFRHSVSNGISRYCASECVLFLFDWRWIEFGSFTHDSFAGRDNQDGWRNWENNNCAHHAWRCRWSIRFDSRRRRSYRGERDKCGGKNTKRCSRDFGKYLSGTDSARLHQLTPFNHFLQQNSEGTITFKLVPSDGKGGQRESKVRVRAHFDYFPENDPYIPCKEAGLGFVRGEVLHIVSQVRQVDQFWRIPEGKLTLNWIFQDDAYWWQARKENDRSSRAGLIPSRALQERRIIHERTQKEPNGDTKSKYRKCTRIHCNQLTNNHIHSPNLHHEGSCASICSTPPTSPNSNSISCRGPKTKKIMYNIDENDDFDREMIATYEEVSKLYPRPGVYRPVVLIGAPGVGRNELKRRLVARDPEKYRSPVPCKRSLLTLPSNPLTDHLEWIFSRYNSTNACRRGCWSRIFIRDARENGCGHCGRQVHWKWWIQGPFVRNICRKCEINSQLRCCLHTQPTLSGHQVAANTAIEAIHCAHTAAVVWKTESIARIPSRSLNVRWNKFTWIHGKRQQCHF